MVIKTVKIALVTAAAGLLVGGVLFGKDLASYMRSSAKGVQQTVRESVPLDFELRRARDLLDQIIPEMHANIRLIAQEEVEVAALKASIAESNKQVADERQRIAHLRDALSVQQASYRFGDNSYTRDQLKNDLARRFERYKEAEVLLTSKQRLLENREKSLQSAMTMLDQTRSQKALLEEKIEALHSQYRLVQAAAAGSQFEMNNSKMAQTRKLIDQIEKRLNVAERVLAHEARFVQPLEIETVNEKDLLTEIDDYFNPPVVIELPAEINDQPTSISDSTETTQQEVVTN